MHSFLKRRRRDAPLLGELELEVLQLLWSRPAGEDSRGVHAALATRDVSLSTIQAALERLHRKGLLVREKSGRAFRYTAAVSREGLIAALIDQMRQSLAAGKMEPVISGFVELVHSTDPALLDEITAAVASLKAGEPQ